MTPNPILFAPSSHDGETAAAASSAPSFKAVAADHYAALTWRMCPRAPHWLNNPMIAKTSGPRSSSALEPSRAADSTIAPALSDPPVAMVGQFPFGRRITSSLPSGESEPMVTLAYPPSEFKSSACEGNGSNADGSKTADGSARYFSCSGTDGRALSAALTGKSSNRRYRRHEGYAPSQTVPLRGAADINLGLQDSNISTPALHNPSNPNAHAIAVTGERACVEQRCGQHGECGDDVFHFISVGRRVA